MTSTTESSGSPLVLFADYSSCFVRVLITSLWTLNLKYTQLYDSKAENDAGKLEWSLHLRPRLLFPTIFFYIVDAFYLQFIYS